MKKSDSAHWKVYSSNKNFFKNTSSIADFVSKFQGKHPILSRKNSLIAAIAIAAFPTNNAS
jgi:hypothetical protein